MAGQSNPQGGRTLGDAVRQRRWLVATVALLVPAIAIGITFLQPELYEAESVVLLGDARSGQNPDRPALAPDPSRAASTAVELGSTERVAESTAARLGRRLDADQVADAIEIGSSATSDLVRIKATDPDPELAADLANAFAAELAELKRALSRLQSGGATVIERADVPPSPSSPKPLFNLLLGFGLGIPLALGIALLVDRADRRVLAVSEFEDLLGVPLLGRIPRSEYLEKAGPGGSVPPMEADAFQMVHANLSYLAVDGKAGIDSVLMTSAAPGDGKSTVALHLAEAAMRAGRRVLLIEADLRNPSLFEIDETPGAISGLCEYLISDEATLRAQVVRVLDEGEAYLDALPAGGIPPNPNRMLGSDRARDLLREARQEYELVVVDAPPIPVVADGIALISEVSGLVAIGRLREDTRDAVVSLREQLEQLDARLLGVVVNFADAGESPYGYYAYGRRHEADGRSSSMSEPRADTAAGRRVVPESGPEAS